MDSDDDIMDLDTSGEIPSHILALSERDMLYELSLPESLKNLTKSELQHLLLFKRTHTEIQWEAELARRQEAQSKALDFERLRKMKGEMAKAPKKSTKGKKESLKVDSEEEDDIFGDSDDDDAPLPDPNASAALLESDEDSILFDSDEEREVTMKKPAKAKKVTAKKAAPKKTKKTKKRARDDDEDEYDDIVPEEEDGEEAEEEKDEADVDLEEDKDESEPAELNDYLKIQTRRKFIEGIINEPYFESAIEGTFVRIVVGEMDGVAVYRMCEVVSIENGTRKYQLPDTKQTTILRMTVAIGPKTKSRIKFTDVSNRRITADELSAYHDALSESRTGKPLTKNQVQRIKQRRDNIVTGHTYTKEEIDRMIMMKSGVSKVGQTTFDIALENIDVEMQKARENNNDEVLERLGKEKELISEKKRFLAEQTTAASIRQVRINDKNYESNYRKDMEAGRKTIIEERAAKKGGEKKLDPFLRRPTRPENVWSAATAPDTGVGETKSKDADDKKKQEKAKNEEKMKFRKTRSEDKEYSFVSDMSLDAVRQRIKRRLGLDPLEVNQLSAREAYLEKVCRGLPAIGTEAREALRNGKSLDDWAKSMSTS